MKRLFYDRLLKWENDRTKEPMLVVGARQVGKTWLIRHFCEENYEHYLYLNFESNPSLNSVFEGSLEPEDIIENLEILTGEEIGENTALFLDEIQKCERAVTSLKYFCESEKNYRIIGAGSLLGVKLNRFESSFPVGKVIIEKMYPMSFEEFLTALGEEKLKKKITESCVLGEALPEALHEKALLFYQNYLFVGGMPRCVADFINKGKRIPDFDRNIQDNILLAYAADMNKYTISAAEGVKIGEVYHSIPIQLAKENPKFKYKEVRPHANKRDFYQPLDWLKTALLIHKVNRVELPQSPLKVYGDEGIFKIYMSDVGLLCCLAGIPYKDIRMEADNIYKGMLTENYCIQEMASKGIRAYYYKPDASMEIDVLLDREGEIIPMEIKSGRHVRSTCLKNYCEKFHPAEKIRLSCRNFSESNDGVRCVPLYALFALLGD